MKKANIILIAVSIFSLLGGLYAFKASRVPRTVFIVDSTHPVPTLRLCTRTAIAFYTTVFIDALPGAPPITSLGFYTSPVNTTVCPATTFYSAQ